MLAEQAKSQGEAQLDEHDADGGRSGLLVQTGRAQERGAGDAGADEGTARPGSEARAGRLGFERNFEL